MESDCAENCAQNPTQHFRWFHCAAAKVIQSRGLCHNASARFSS